jgi:hypothetical protein
VHVAIFAGLFRGVYSMKPSGTGLFFDYGSAIVAGQVPYRDVFVEYPPLSLVFFTLPRLVGESFRWYYVWFQIQVVLADLVILGALSAAREPDTEPWRILAPYTSLVLAVGPITLQQFDIFPAALTILAVVCYARRRDAAAWILLALGTMTKVYPALLGPVFLLLDDTSLARRVGRAAVAFSATCLVVLAPLLIIAPTSLGGMLAFHSQRGIHLDSEYATIAFAARALHLSFVHVVSAYRSVNIEGAAAAFLVRWTTPLLAAALLLAYALVLRHVRRAGPTRDVRIVATSSALVLLAGLVTSKVLSPQYLIWVLPLMPLLVQPLRWVNWGLFAAVGVLTYYIYPLRYADLEGLVPSAIAALAARNLLLIALTIAVARSLRAVESGVETSS